jgi:hypothetical protein
MALLRETPGEMLRFDAAGKNLWHEAVREMPWLRVSTARHHGRVIPQPNSVRAIASRGADTAGEPEIRPSPRRLPAAKRAVCHRRRAALPPMRGLRHAAKAIFA